MAELDVETFVGEGVTAVVFDDSPETIESHLLVFEALSIRHVVARSLTELRALLLTHDEILLFLDQHMPDIYDFSEVDMPTIKTDRGENVGMAVVRGMLPAIGRTDVPSYLLSGFPLSRGAEEGMARARDRGIEVDYIRKDNIEKFEENVKSSVVSLEHKRVQREFQAAERIVAEWTKESAELLPLAFGYPIGENATEWSTRRIAAAEDITVDLKGRVAMVLFIKESLAKLFGDGSIDREIAWLKEEDAHLFGGKSPWDCIFSGKQYELAAVAGLLARVIG